MRWILSQTNLPQLHGNEIELTVTLADHRGMIPLNAACFGRNRTTDVISQAYAPPPGSSGLQGEIVVNVERAGEEGLRRRGFDHELALYLAHGIDHLAGATDHTPTLRARMLRRETAWLEKAIQSGLLKPGLFQTPS